MEQDLNQIPLFVEPTKRDIYQNSKSNKRTVDSLDINSEYNSDNLSDNVNKELSLTPSGEQQSIISLNSKQKNSEDKKQFHIYILKKNMQNSILNNTLTPKTDENIIQDEDILYNNENNQNQTCDRKMILKNIQTGSTLQIIKAPQSNYIQISLNQKKQWKNYWKIIKINNEILWKACENGKVNQVLDILDQSKNKYCADINSRVLDNFTALHIATQSGHLNIIQLLLAKGADVNATSSAGRTPLHLACIQGNFFICKILTESNANVNAQDSDLNTPLHYASQKCYAQIVQYLLEEGANQNLTNNEGIVPIQNTLDINIRKLFLKFEESYQNDIDKLNQRAIFNDIIIPNSRQDYVKKILFQKFSQYKNGIQNLQSDKKENIKSNQFIRNSKIDQYYQKLKQQYTPELHENGKEKVNLNSFNILFLLGKGSFGHVFLVLKKTSKKLYAMKVLSKHKVYKDNLLRYVQTEKNVLSSVNHPFILKLYWSFQTDQHLFLVTDYCSGGDIGRYISQNKKLPESVARNYCAEIILGIEALHQDGIAYRDLKPENVLIDENGHIQLADFGLAKENMFKATSNSFCGSVAYLAPEIILKIGHTKSIDWYLLGLTLYEMLVGVPPYYSQDKYELYNNILQAPLELPNDMSIDAKNFIKLLLKRSPEQRLGSIKGAQEIKEHPFFKNFDWNDVLNKQLSMPKHMHKLSIQKNIKSYKYQLNRDTLDVYSNQISNWSFCEEQ